MNRWWLLAALVAAPLSAAPTPMQWTIDGVRREALVFAPATPSAKAPVIFAFHGHTGSMQRAAQNMRYQELMPRAVVVYMQGLPTPSPSDPAGNAAGWQSRPGQLGDRDVKFFDAVLATVRATFRIDEGRVYLMGYSNGGLFAFLLWEKRGSTFAAIAICAAVLLPEVHPTLPRPVIHVAGRADTIAPFAMQEATIKAERKINGKRAAVDAVIHDGGHMPPPWTSQRIAAFFAEHHR